MMSEKEKARTEKIKDIVHGFAKARCDICNGKGTATLVADNGVTMILNVCTCAQNKYKKIMEQAVQEPCRDCQAIRRFCSHRPVNLLNYAKSKTQEME